MTMSQGYRAEPVEGAPKPGLQCIHCEFLLREPVQTEDGVRVCKTCYSAIQSLANATCDKCGVISTGIYYPDKAVQREVLALLVYCSYKEHGCRWEGQMKQWESHCKTCSYKGVLCPNEGCSVELPQQKLEQHKEVCPYRLVSCEYCSMKIPFNQVQDHELECEDFPVTCNVKHCGKQYLRRKVLQHNEEECSVLQCYSCSTKVFRETGEEISTECPPAKEPPAECPPAKEPPAECPPAEDSTAECRGGPRTHHSNTLPSSCTRPPNSATSPNHAPNTAASLHHAPSSATSPNHTPSVHLADPLQNFRHHHMLARKVQRLEDGMGTQHKTIKKLESENFELREELKTSINDMKSLIDTLSGRGTGPPVDHTHITKKLNELAKSDAEKSSSVSRLKRELGDLVKIVETLKIRTGDLMTVHPDSPVVDVRGVGGGRTTADKGDGDMRLAAAEKRMEEMARQLTAVKVHGQDLELQLQASLASTHNGSFLWRIPDVARRRRDAVDERVTSIYSPPFYTGRNGYKMCVRAYLNGDGMGYKTHLSLFFVLMKGECDPLLKWPFEYKVSMILVDQTHRKHIVQTFKPTPESNSFQQPTTDMNVASGCPQFAKLTVFNDDSYITNDVMFIKCIVDTTKIFHP